MMTLLANMDKKQMWDSFRFIIAVIFTAGVLYATVQAAVSDIGGLEETVTLQIDKAGIVYKETDQRLRLLEQENARRAEWEKNVAETLQRIERKIERSGGK